jgi:hypothetical protein
MLGPAAALTPPAIGICLQSGLANMYPCLPEFVLTFYLLPVRYVFAFLLVCNGCSWVTRSQGLVTSLPRSLAATVTKMLRYLLEVMMPRQHSQSL